MELGTEPPVLQTAGAKDDQGTMPTQSAQMSDRQSRRTAPPAPWYHHTSGHIANNHTTHNRCGSRVDHQDHTIANKQLPQSSDTEATTKAMGNTTQAANEGKNQMA